MYAADHFSENTSRNAPVLRSLLVVRLGAMGDVLHAMPAVAALRTTLPATRLGWVVDERWADLVRRARIKGDLGRPLVDQIHTVCVQAWRHSLSSARTWRELAAARRELLDCGYEAAVDFQGAIRSALVARLSGAAIIYGFAEPRENVASMFYTKLAVRAGKHVIEQNISLAAAVTRLHARVPTVELSDGSQQKNMLPRLETDYVVMNPGAGWGSKQWPAERYGQVAKSLLLRSRMKTFINAGPQEDDLVRAAQVASEGAARPLSCSPAELVDILRSARLFIGGDTGPMHLAAALGIPVVAIFGPTDPSRTGPYGTRSIVLRNPNSRTTSSHGKAPDAGMLEISTDEVVTAAVQLLRVSRE